MPGIKAKFPQFEKPIIKINEKIESIEKKNKDTGSEGDAANVENLKKERELLVKKIYSDLTPWQKVQLARHPMRPRSLDYIEGIFEEFFQLHGDRKFGDDKAVVGGMAMLNGQAYMVIGQQKGKSPEENVKRNFGMLHPEGYRKGLRLMKLAEKFSIPVINFIDTPGAYPGIKAEERGQAEAIATNLKEMIGLRTPITVVIIGEGGSGGALGLGVGDRILMLENSVYFVCTPEACGAILWKDSTLAEKAAEKLRLTAENLYDLGVIDEVVKEPSGSAHWDYDAMFDKLKKRIVHHNSALKRTKPENLNEKRYKKFRKMGVYEKSR